MFENMVVYWSDGLGGQHFLLHVATLAIKAVGLKWSYFVNFNLQVHYTMELTPGIHKKLC
jgi:hypothetical protein